MGVPKYGGIGGKGGDVVLETKEGNQSRSMSFRTHQSSFLHLIPVYFILGVLLHNLEQQYKQKIVKAATGSNAHATCILGRSGTDKIISVPPGIVVVNEFNQIIGIPLK